MQSSNMESSKFICCIAPESNRHVGKEVPLVADWLVSEEVREGIGSSSDVEVARVAQSP